MNAADQNAALRLSDWAPVLQDALASDRSASATDSVASSGRRTVFALVGTTVVLLGVLVAFTIQAASSYLPVFPTMVP